LNYTNSGSISPIIWKPVYFSDRQIPLITQELITYDAITYFPMLTVENYEKWYKLFIINTDETVESLIDLDEPNYGTSFVDHSFNPSAFHNTTKRLGLRYDNRTFAMICERWVEDALDDDWTKLHLYLPKGDK
jgi:hypothetical protein